MRESEEKLRLLADTIPQLAWMAQPDGHIFWYNRRWYEYTGTTPEQMEGWGWQSVHDPEALPKVLERWKGSIASGEPFDMVFPLKGADGRFRPFLTRVNPLRDAEGRTLYWFGTNTDISEQKRAEDASRFLAEASAALAAVVDYESTLGKVARLAVPFFADWCAVDVAEADGALRRLAVVHVDPSKVGLANELHRRYPPRPDQSYGPPHVLPTGKPELAEEITDSILVASAQDEDHLALLRGLGLRSYICVPLAVRGEPMGVLTFIMSESGRHYGPADLTLAEDLAHRAVVAIDNTRLYAELREADRRKDEFLATLAHELRNPLAPIRNTLQILKMPKLDAATVERSREMMERQVHHLVRLVDDLLDVSRVMRGKIDSAPGTGGTGECCRPCGGDGPAAHRGPRARVVGQAGRRIFAAGCRPGAVGPGRRQPVDERRQVHRGQWPHLANGPSGKGETPCCGSGTPASALRRTCCPRFSTCSCRWTMRPPARRAGWASA